MRTDAEGDKAVRITQISPDVIGQFTWMTDSRPSDVVLVREFR